MANFNDLINLEGLTEYDSKIKEHIGEKSKNYTAASGAAQVQLAIDASSREISAKLVNGGVGTDAIAEGAGT